MQVIDLTKEHEQLYFVCLEDWSEDMKDAGNYNKNWGISSALYIDNKKLNTGPPPTYDKIRKLIEKHVKNL
ncbi:MAG: hypothetical protein JXB48_07975 [Candidatus Latescibacteria bacterium]|nr:hypothetical protein [Candidatus Latescibacterota bacterium]